MPTTIVWNCNDYFMNDCPVLEQIGVEKMEINSETICLLII